LNSRVLLTIAAAFVLTGCRSDALRPSEATPVSQNLIHAPSLHRGAASAIATITRDSGGPPTSTRWLIYLDGQVIARIGKAETFTVNAPVGQHILGVEPDAKIKVLQVINTDQVFNAGHHYYFRVMYTGSEYRIQRTMPSGDTR